MSTIPERFFIKTTHDGYCVIDVVDDEVMLEGPNYKTCRLACDKLTNAWSKGINDGLAAAKVVLAKTVKEYIDDGT